MGHWLLFLALKKKKEKKDAYLRTVLIIIMQTSVEYSQKEKTALNS